MFRYMVSLGCYCGVAASMSKLGLRYRSGPFDWYISKYNGVIENIKNHFADFLNLDNLYQKDNDFCCFTMINMSLFLNMN